MDPKRWQQIKEVFHEALKQEPARRTAYLDEACGDDAEMRTEVESLISSHESDPGFIEPGSDRSRAAMSSFAEDFTGEMAGPYRLIRPIASGGMGVVYLAERADQAYDKEVAVKLLRSDRFLQTEKRRLELLRRFQLERQTLANLDHPNIARLHDGGSTEGGVPYLVMDYIDGQPIDDYCDDKRLSIDDRLTLFQGVCSAVQYAHQHLVVHRDLKPSNILVDAQGVPQLLDFGIAKLLDDNGHGKTARTQTAMQPMTPDYASPEQVRSEQVTTASDVYSLGVILYEMLTGHRPYQLSTMPWHKVADVICEHLPERPSTVVMTRTTVPTDDGETDDTITPESIGLARELSPDRLRRRLAGDLDVIVLKALRKEPEQRYASVEQLSEDIRRYLGGEQITARPTSMAYQFQVFARRNKLVVGAAVAVFLTLVGGIAVSMALLAQTQVERDRALTAERTAEQRRTEAQAVSAFLSDTLATVDTSGAQGREMTVREMITSAAKRIEVKAKNDPLVEAALRRAVGSAFRSLGDLASAEKETAAALAIHRRVLGERNVETLRSKVSYAAVLQDKDELTTAESLYREALAVQRDVLGEGHADTLVTMKNLGGVLQDQGRLVEAEKIYRATLRLYRQSVGNDDPETLSTMNNLATLLHQTGRAAESERLHRTILEARRRVLGVDHPETLRTQYNLANVLITRRAFDEALSFLRQTVDAQRRLLGADHVDTLRTATGLCRLLLSMGTLTEAETQCRESLDNLRRTVGDAHRLTIECENSLVAVLHSAAKLPDAEALLRDVAVRRSAALGEQHRDTLLARYDLANLLQDSGQFAESETLYRSVLATQRAVFGDRDSDTLWTTNSLAYLLLSSDPVEALSLARNATARSNEIDFADTLALAYKVNGDLDQAIATLNNAMGKVAPDLLIKRSFLETRMIAFLREAGDTDQADRRLTNIIDQTRDQHGALMADLAAKMCDLAFWFLDHGEYVQHEQLCSELAAVRRGTPRQGQLGIASSALAYAFDLNDNGRYADAEPVLRTCLEIAGLVHPDGDATSAIIQSALGQCLMGQEQLSEAEALLVNAYDALRGNATHQTNQIRTVLRRLIELYEDKDDATQAAHYRRLLTNEE